MKNYIVGELYTDGQYERLILGNNPLHTIAPEFGPMSEYIWTDRQVEELDWKPVKQLSRLRLIMLDMKGGT